MKKPPPPLNHVRSFEAAARHLSFTKAAEELGYTQAAISTHVRALEKYVGRALFRRRARSIELTEIGEAYLPTLRQALAQIDSATDAIVSGARGQSVVVACPISLAENWLPAVLRGFRADHPGVEVVVLGTVWDDPADSIADLVISILREDEVPDGARKLWDERLLLLAAPDLAAGLSAPADLVARDRVLVSGRQEFWAIMAAALGLEDPERPAPLKTNSTNISLEMAAEGLGAVVTLASLGALYLRRGLLVEPFGIRPRSPWSYYVTATRAGTGRGARALLAHILDSAGA